MVDFMEDAPQVREPWVQHSEAALLVVELARSLHAAGAPSHRLEASVGAVSRAVGVHAAVFAQPTSVLLELDGRTCMMRVEPADPALADLVIIDQVARDVEVGLLSPGLARQRLGALAAQPAPYGRLAIAAAWAGVAGGAAVFFGGGAADVLAAAALSGLLGLLPGRLGELLPLLAALVVGLGARLLAQLHPLHVDIVILSGAIALLPGFTLTVALTEVATRHLASGTARLAAAGVTFLQLGVGLGLAEAVSRRLLPPVIVPALNPGSGVVEALAITTAALSFLVLFRSRWQDLPAVLAVAFLAVHGTRLGGSLLGPEAAPYLGGLAVGLAANAHARLRQVPALVLLVPGLLLLVPGSLGFRGVQALVDSGGDLMDGARMFMVGASLVAGILTSNALLPPRRAL